MRICYVNLLYFQMDSQIREQLQATRNSFFKLQDNFNHNLLVIKQLEEDNAKLIQENQYLRSSYHQEVDHLHGALEQLRNQNKSLNILVKSEVDKVRALCQEQTQHIIEMMNEKMMEQKRFQAQKFAKQRKEYAQENQKYEQSVKHFSYQNSKLIQTIKQLRNENERLQNQLSNLISQKESFNNKFNLHEKELENMRNANQQWQRILKDKVRQATKQKQKIEQQLSQTKLAYKLKLKSVKDEASKKIEQLQQNKQKLIRNLTQQAKQIKYRFDLTMQEIEKLRSENKNIQKQKQKLEKTVQELSKQNVTQKQIEYIKKMYEQEKMQLKNQIKIVESQRNNIKQQFRDINQRREEVQKSVQRLKSALMAAQKQNDQNEKKNKKIQKQLKQLRAQVKRSNDINNINFRPFNKYEQEDIVNQNATQNQNQNVEYSKYFSEDMGPGDQMFFMENSVPKTPKNIPKNNQTNPVNHQLMKKIGQLQIEIDQYKILIKSMTDQIQRVKSSYLDQIGIKDQQIKLGRDEIHLLREKINEREQQLLQLNTLRQQTEDKNRKIQQYTAQIAVFELQIKQKDKLINQVKQKLLQSNKRIEEIQEQLKNCSEEKKILDQINEQLRGEIHQYKNRVKLYNQSQEQEPINLNDQAQQFQDLDYDQTQNYSEQFFKRSNEMKRTYKIKQNRSKSRSISGSKNKKNQYTKVNPLQVSKTSLKLKDLVIKKKQLQMEGKKIQMQFKEPNNNKNIERTGTASQKQILENMKKKSKQKERQRGERVRDISYNRLVREDEEAQENHQFD